MHFIPLFRSLVDETKTKLLKYVGKWSSFRFWDAFVSSLAALAPAAHTLSKTKLAEATSSPACIFHIMQAHSAWPILVWRKHQEQKKSKWLQRKYDREGHGISLLIEEEQIMSFPLCFSRREAWTFMKGQESRSSMKEEKNNSLASLFLY